MTAVTFGDNEAATRCDRRIAELRRECFGERCHEFHFSKCSDEHREKFLASISNQDFFYLAFVLNKAKLYGPGFAFKSPFYKYTASLLFENAKPYLRDASVVIDASGEREFRLQLQKYLKKKVNTDRQIIRKVKTENSHSNNLLQLADMVCGAVARSFRVEKPERQRFRKLIAHRELHLQMWPRL